MKFEDVKKDYIKLLKEYGYPEDMTGGFVDAEKMEIVIRNPTKKNAAKYMADVIAYGFQLGEFWNSEEKGHIPIANDEFLFYCYETYA